jgi:hypothetical protein
MELATDVQQFELRPQPLFSLPILFGFHIHQYLLAVRSKLTRNIIALFESIQVGPLTFRLAL